MKVELGPPVTLYGEFVHKLPTTIVTSLTLRYIVLSSVAKMHAACSRLPHNVLHSPSFSIQFNFMLLGSLQLINGVVAYSGGIFLAPI